MVIFAADSAFMRHVVAFRCDFFRKPADKTIDRLRATEIAGQRMLHASYKKH
jgi:hypothetical protein